MNNAELINKQDAIHAVLHNTGDAAVAAVQDIKAVDAVIVVRCKDCYYYQPENENTEAFCKITKLGCGEDFFCGDMDRKDGEDEQ